MPSDKEDETTEEKYQEPDKCEIKFIDKTW